MSSITIHALDPVLALRLDEEAIRAKKSKNQLIKDLLSRSLGMRTGDAFADDYREFCGLWDEAEFRSFQEAQADNARIDTEDWRP